MRGFSLLEVLVATTLVAISVGSFAQLVALAGRTNLHARWTTVAAVLAQRKIEELLPEPADALTPSPDDALVRNVDGYCDFADADGQLLGGGPAMPAGSAYLRRWSMHPLPNDRRTTWILQVMVTDLRGRIVTRFVAAKSGKVS